MCEKIKVQSTWNPSYHLLSSRGHQHCHCCMYFINLSFVANVRATTLILPDHFLLKYIPNNYKQFAYLNDISQCPNLALSWKIISVITATTNWSLATIHFDHSFRFMLNLFIIVVCSWNLFGHQKRIFFERKSKINK